MQNLKKLSQIDNFITLIEPVEKGWNSQKQAKQNKNNINNNNNNNNTININNNQDNTSVTTKNKITNQNKYDFSNQLSIQSSILNSNFLIEPNFLQSPFPQDFSDPFSSYKDPFSLSKDPELETELQQQDQNKFESYSWMEENIAENSKVPIDSDQNLFEETIPKELDQYIPVLAEQEQENNDDPFTYFQETKTVTEIKEKEKGKGKEQTVIKPPVPKQITQHQETDSCCITTTSLQKRKCEEVIIQESKKVRGTPPKPKDGDPEKLKKYEEVRKKNNYSARQSRTKKKERDQLNLEKLQLLEEENAKLKVLLDSVKQEAQTLKELLQMTIQNNTFP